MDAQAGEHVKRVPRMGACTGGAQAGGVRCGYPGEEQRGPPKRGACLPPALRGSAALGSAWVFPCQVRHQAGLVELRWELKSERTGDDGLRGGKADAELCV